MRHLINKYALQTPATNSNWLVMSSQNPSVSNTLAPLHHPLQKKGTPA